jgi:glucose-1-phosphate adenylyltransferase
MDCRVKDAIIAHGVFMDKCQVEHAIIGVRQRIASGCKITNAMVIGADYYESDEQRAALLAAGKVPIGIGADCVINNAIIDKNTRIGKKCVITNAAGIEEVR